MNEFKPYIFFDNDKTSHTFGLWSIRWSESMSVDGYPSYESALSELYIKSVNKRILEGSV